MRLNAKNLGLAGGILWGVVLSAVTLVSVPTGYAGEFLGLVGSIYPGYSVSWLGALVGLVYGFIDGFICLFVLALLYNWLQGKGTPQATS